MVSPTTGILVLIPAWTTATVLTQAYVSDRIKKGVELSFSDKVIIGAGLIGIASLIAFLVVRRKE